MAKILLSDDNERMFDTSRIKAHKLGIDLICVTNWEDAQIELESNPNQYDGLILDGRGKLTEAASGNNARHYHTAMTWLNQEYGKGNSIATVFYTGFLDDFEEHIDIKQPFIIDVCDKDKVGIEVVIDKIVKHNAKLPENILKSQYKGIFKLFDDKRLPKNMQKTMLEVLNGLSFGTVNKTDYNRIREIIEEMLKMAGSIDPQFIPVELLTKDQDNRPNLKYSVRYLIGQEVVIPGGKNFPKQMSPIMSAHIGWIFSSVVQCGQILSHSYRQNHSHYAYKSTVFGLLEILMWYKDYLATKYSIL